MACNVWRRGNYPQFSRFMNRTYSAEIMEELDIAHRLTIKMNREDYNELIAKYKGLTS
jgi:hypothetical protein